MARTPETPLEIDERYRDLLRELVKANGGQNAVAEMIEVDQATISRTLAPGGRATYTTLKKLSDELNAPAPVYPVRDEDHADWCRLGAILAESDPGQFQILLTLARRDAERTRPIGMPIPPSPEEIDALKSVIANPLPGKKKKRDRAD